MRIITLVHFYLPYHRAGAELMLHQMLAELVKAGHSVEVVATHEKISTPIIINGVHVSSDIRALKTNNYDLGITHLLEAPRLAAWGKQTGKPILQIVHNTNRQTDTSLTQPWDLLVFNTKWVQEHYMRDGIIVHPPVDIEKFQTTPGTKIGLINMLPEKGSHVFYHLAERFPQYEFLAVEGGYLQHTQDRRNFQNVTWQPNTDNMRDDVYSQLRILLTPSEYESYGMVGLEASASGIPVLAHPTKGLQESIPNATFIDRDDLKMWEISVRTLMEQPMQHYTASQKAKQDANTAETNRSKELNEWVKHITSFQ